MDLPGHRLLQRLADLNAELDLLMEIFESAYVRRSRISRIDPSATVGADAELLAITADLARVTAALKLEAQRLARLDRAGGIPGSTRVDC